MKAKNFIPVLVVTVLTVLGSPDAFGGDAVSRAQREIDAGRLDAAVRILDERLERRPEDTEALKARALAASGLGRYGAAVRDYEAVLEKDPDDAEVHRDLGMVLTFKVKDAPHASEHLDRYLGLINEADIPAEVVRVFKSLDQGRSKQEHRVAEELVRMAQAFEAAGKTKVAVRVYERALSIRRACAPCHESLGRLLRDEKHLAKARLLQGGG